jgi:hypothetical protein
LRMSRLMSAATMFEAMPAGAPARQGSGSSQSDIRAA